MQQETHRQYIKKKVEEITSLQPLWKRWKPAAQLALDLNPLVRSGNRLREENALTIRRNQKLREVQLNKYAANQGLRFAMSIPEAVVNFIELFDPTAFQGTPTEQKTKMGRMVKLFPEYTIPEKY